MPHNPFAQAETARDTDHSPVETDGGNYRCTACDKWATSKGALGKTECNPDHDNTVRGTGHPGLDLTDDDEEAASVEVTLDREYEPPVGGPWP